MVVALKLIENISFRKELAQSLQKESGVLEKIIGPKAEDIIVEVKIWISAHDPRFPNQI